MQSTANPLRLRDRALRPRVGDAIGSGERHEGALFASAFLMIVPLGHPLLIPLIGVPSHLLWWVHVLPVAIYTRVFGLRGAALSISTCAFMVFAGERTFGAGYFVPADWATSFTLAIALGLTNLLVASFAMFVRQEQERSAWLAEIPERSPHPTMEARTDGEVIYANATAQSTADQVGGAAPAELLPPGHIDLVGQVLASREVLVGMESSIRGRVFSWSYSPTGSGDTVHIHGTELTQRRTVERELNYRMLHDPLTGLANRRLFLDRLQQALHREPTSTAVLVIDLVGLKTVNDGLGHAAGDQVLSTVGQRLVREFGESVTIGRINADFGVLTSVRDSEDSLEQARRALGIADLPLDAAGTQVEKGVRVGVCIGDGAETQASELLRRANVAVRRAKSEGRSVLIYDPDLDGGASTRVHTEVAIRSGMERGEFVCFYQPLVDVLTGAITGVEALARWQHPDRGLLGPMEFIPLAEETGLIVPMGLQLAEQAIRQMATWHRQVPGFEHAVVSVNLAPRQLLSPTLVDDIASMLSRHSFPPACLQLEITETDIMQQVAEVSRLEALGVQIAIDDFGTGYSSLAHLKLLDVHTLKIDRAFVRGLASNTEDRAIIDAIMTLASTMGLKVVAEGVETAAQARILRDAGVEQAQGYLWARPLPPTEVLALLASGLSVA